MYVCMYVGTYVNMVVLESMKISVPPELDRKKVTDLPCQIKTLIRLIWVGIVEEEEEEEEEERLIGQLPQLCSRASGSGRLR